MRRGAAGTVVRIAVAAAGIVYIVALLDWPEATAMLREARSDLLLAGLLLAFVLYPIQGARWRMLLRARGIETTWWNAFRLVLVGIFFNAFLPGLTGGDVVRAGYAARDSDRKTDAVISVLVDRALGLLALVVLAGLAGILVLGDPIARRVTAGAWFGLLGAWIAVRLYVRPSRRDRFGRNRAAPSSGRGVLGRVDDALVAYAGHRRTVLLGVVMTVPGHLGTCLGTALAGHALGMQAPFGLLVTTVPVMILGGAVPVSYQGLGVMEAVGRSLLEDPPRVLFHQIVAMLMCYRAFQFAYGLVGGLLVLRGGIRLRPET